MRCLFFILAFVYCGFLVAQVPDSAMVWSDRNLIYNPSFEQYTECPRKIDAMGVLTIVEGWYQPTAGSADYFNRCGTRVCAVPDNKMGSRVPHSGDAYCGVYCSKNEYREYLQTELRVSMQKGHRYQVAFWVALSHRSPMAVASLGALITPSRVVDTGDGILMYRDRKQLSNNSYQTISTYYNPQMVNPVNRLLDSVSGWQLVSGEYVSQGGEKFLTIGNFAPLSLSGSAEVYGLVGDIEGAYYFIDDVLVQCLDCDENQPVQHPDTVPSLVKGTTLILENIFFETDKSQLLQQSYNELQRLIQLLNNNPTMRVAIIGHTDNQGKKAYNQQLSERRAQSVVEYLQSHGIKSSRLKYMGMGDSQPIDSNDTAEGRARNRRVALEVL